MHRTLERRAVKPVQRTCAGQQRQFDAFRTEYTIERPHDTLGGDTPGSRYVPSPWESTRWLGGTVDGVWAIAFNTVLLASLDERDCVIRG